MPRKPLDLSGKTFGELKVIERAGSSQKGAALWRCHCNRCGGGCIVEGQRISAGKKDCGCLAKDRKADLSGRHIGALYIIKRLDERYIDGGYLYLCRCDVCGGEKVIPACTVRSAVKSCGCLVKSVEFGEKLREAAKKGGERMRSDPEVRERMRAARFGDPEQFEKDKERLAEQRAKLIVDGVNLPQAARTEANKNNKLGIRGVYRRVKNGRTYYQGRCRVHGEVRYTKLCDTPGEAKELYDEIKAELIEKYNVDFGPLKNRKGERT